MTGHHTLTDEEKRRLYVAALSRAPHHGETREVRALRDFTHGEMLAGRIDGATQDRIGQLLDDLARTQQSKAGDVIGPNTTDVPWDVLQVTDCQDDIWFRAFGDNRYRVDDATGERDRSQEYDWSTAGGWSTTEGLLDYAPLTVTMIAERPKG